MSNTIATSNHQKHNNYADRMYKYSEDLYKEVLIYYGYAIDNKTNKH